MDIYIRDGMAFVVISDDTMLCIGSKEEVDKATEREIIYMVGYAFFVSATFKKQEARETNLERMPLATTSVN